MFKLKKTECKLESVRPRTSMGDESVTRIICEVVFNFETNNAILETLAKGLTSAFFKREGAPDLAGQGMPEDYLGELRFPGIATFEWNEKVTGYRLEVERLLGLDEKIILLESQVDKITCTCKNGGVVDVKFRVTCTPDEEDIGLLCGLIKHDVHVWLLPPSAEKVADMFIEKQKKSLN